MQLKITDVSFTLRNNWLFKLTDGKSNEFYIMDEAFYLNKNLKVPISRKEVSFYSKGQLVTSTVKTIGDKEVVLDFK